MSSTTPQQKLQAVEAYLSGQWSMAQITQRHGVTESTVHRWLALYRQHGAAGLAQQPRRSYDLAFRLQVLSTMRSQALSAQQAALRFGVRDLSIVGQWVRLYDAGGKAALAPQLRGSPTPMRKPPPVSPAAPPAGDHDTRSREELLKELDWLRMENAYLKKLEALVQAKRKAAPQKKRS